MKKYGKFKKIDLDFFNEIPVHWKVVKMKYVCEIFTGNSLNDELKSIFESYDSNNVPYISSKDINVNTNEINYESGLRIPFGDSRFKLAPKNSSVLCIEGGSAGRKLGFTNQEVYFVNKLACFVPFHLIISKYFYFFIQSEIFQNQFFNSMTGLIGGVSLSNLKNFFITVPSSLEQNHIISFLDHQTSIIDQLIHKKESLIALLEEKKKSLINEAVTKGLYPNVKMKDSGVEWIGEIPEHWEVISLRYLTNKIGSGVTPKGGAEVYVEEGAIFIRSQNVHFDGLRLDDVVKIDFTTHERMGNTKVFQGDVLLNITGASIGRCTIVELEDEINVNQHVCIIRPFENLNNKFLNYLLQSEIGQTQITLGITGGNREGLNFEAIKRFVFPIPPIAEQIQIVNQIENSLKKIFETNYKLTKQIHNLKEYRQSIISEAVTGKIDVSDWKAE